MAKLPALIKTLEFFHPSHDEASIRYAARALREAHKPLLSAGAGGRGAPHMTPLDAVHLLLALNLAQSPGQYAQAALRGSGLLRPEDKSPHAAETPSVVVEVMTAETLGHALKVLVERAEELSSPWASADPFAGPAISRRPYDGPVVEVELVQQGLDVLARVAMYWKGPKGHSRTERQYGVRSASPGYGRWTTVHFDQALFLALKRTVVADPPWAFAAAPVHR